MGRKILTNKYNLPDTLVQAVQYDTHNLAGDISVTTLIDGPQIRYLKAIHDYEVDVKDCLYALMGTALHHVLERANISSVRKRAFMLVIDTLIEKQKEIITSAPDKASELERGAKWLTALIPIFFPEVAERYIFEVTMTLNMGTHVISGTFDLYDKHTGILYDYKFCSVYQWIFQEARKKWEEQTNIYAYMLRTTMGLNVTGIRVVAFFRDWNAGKLMQGGNYPDMQIKEIIIPLWSDEKVKDMIDYYLNIHRQAEAGNVPECSGEVRWATADVYAVRKKGLKRAISGGLKESRRAAEMFIAENNHKHGNALEIDPRPGESRRCKEYCVVAAYCPQWKAEQERARENGSDSEQIQ